MRFPVNTVFIQGVPRSGTSWLGQILNSSPRVAFRFQPLFSYAFKDRLNPDSTREEIECFLEEVYTSHDAFLLQVEQIARGAYPEFEKESEPTHLVMKHVRYHHILENLIIQFPEVRVIGTLRHPCAVINSWLRAPREFRLEWDVHEEWRNAQSKNQERPEEFYGFEKWKEVAEMFLRLSLDYPRNFILVHYPDLNLRTTETVQKIFDFCGLDMSDQTADFLSSSKTVDHPHVNAVYRNRNDDLKWTRELDREIAEKILEEVRGTHLESLLEQR